MPPSAPSNATNRRSPAWGANLPADDEDARSRLLDAAEQCYSELGPSRTKMSHIATRAGIHRTTIYSYFRNRDEVLAACYLRAASVVLDSAEACWVGDAPFIDQLIDACVVGISVARELPAMRILIDRNELPYAQTVAAASEAWRRRLHEAFGQRLAAAAAAGAVRSDVTADTLAQWVVRVCISLTVEPGRPEDGGDRGVLNTFLPRCLAC